MGIEELDRESRLRLVRFVCSFAWADLEVQDAERKLVLKLLSELGLDASEKAEAERWLALPPFPEDVDPMDIPVEHRQIFLNTVLQVIGADGVVDRKEMETLAIFEKLLRADPDEDTFG